MLAGCLRQRAAYIKVTDQRDAIMSDDSQIPQEKPKLPPAAQRALAEAEERRQKAKTLDLPTELGGRDGPEPVRYGDWEKKGLAVDF